MFDNDKLQKNSIIEKILVLFTVIIILLPVIWILLFSFKTQNEIMLNPFAWPQSMNLANYQKAFKVVPWATLLKNSFIIMIITVPAELLLVVASSFAISRVISVSPKVRNFIHTYFTAGLIIPAQIMIFPVYKMLLGVKLWNTHWGVILTLIGWAAPFATSLLVSAFNKVPSSLEEAAVLDGCNIWQLFLNVMVPLVKNTIFTILIIRTISTWNEYFLTKILLSANELWPISLVPVYFSTQYGRDFGLTAAGVAIILLPQILFYLLMQKHIISGVSTGAVKE